MSRSWTRGATLATAYLLLSLGWLVIGWGIVPDLLQAAYHGHGPGPLNRLLARTSRRPFEHYLGLWYAFVGAVLLGIGAHAVVVAAIRARRPGPGLAAFLVATAALFLGLTILSGPRQDYSAYLEIWDVIRRGGDPWWVAPRRGYPLNAYGPLFVLLTPLAGANPLAPKVVFSLAYLLLVVDLAIRGAAEPRLSGWSRGAWLALLVNPSFWIQVGWYGHFDILMALTCLAAVRARERGRDATAGAWLGLGFLLKFLPVALGPFLGVDRRRPRWPFLLVAGAVMVVGMAAAVAVWGPAALRPFRVAATRPSQLLSIFRFLRGPYSPLRAFGVSANLDVLAMPIMVLALVLVWVACWRLRCDLASSALLGALTVVLCYKVGFAQYQAVPLVLASYWWLRHPEVPRSDPLLGAALAGYVGWIVGLEIFDVAVGGTVAGNPAWAWFEDVPGLPTCALGAWLVVELLRWARRQRTFATSRV